MKRAILTLVPAAAAAAVVIAGASASTPAPTLTISHVVKGCHVWSLNGAKPAVSQTVKLHPGQALTIRNGDVMPHQLVKVAGATGFAMKLVQSGMTGTSTGMMKAPYGSGMMPHMMATLKVTFSKAGVYQFKTKAGEDYMAGVKTVGEDNVLKVRVVVG